MNKPIARLFGLVVVMFALLIAFTSRWTVFDAKALQNNKLNARTLLETQRIRRGTIYADNGTALADSVSQPGAVYTRFYPFGSLFAAPVGYAFPNQLAAGIELFRNGVLTGTPIQHESVIDQLEGKQNGGDSVYTTLDPAAQQVAMSALAATHLSGAVVAMVPSTGAVKVFALTGHPTGAPRAYAWSSPIEGSTKRRFFARVDPKGRHGDRRDRHRPVHADLACERQLAANLRRDSA